jgi:hypothetical protein
MLSTRSPSFHHRKNAAAPDAWKPTGSSTGRPDHYGPVHGDRDVQHNAHSGAKSQSRPKIS